MIHIHFLFGRSAFSARETREIFFAETPENNPPPEQPEQQPQQPQQPQAPETNNQNESPEQRQQRLAQEAAELGVRQQAALDQVNAELRKWNEEQKAQKPDHVDKEFKDLPDEDRANIQNTVMAKTGASVSSEGRVTVSNDEWEVGLNKAAGMIGKAMAPFMKMMEKLKPLFKQLGFKTEENEKKDDGQVAKKESQNRVDALLSNQPDRQKVQADLIKNRDTAQTAKAKAEKEKGTLEADIRSKETAITAKQNAIVNSSDPKAIEAAEKQIAVLKTQIETVKTQITEKEKEIDKQKKIYDESVADLATLADLTKTERQGKDSEIIASMKEKNDGKWHPATEIKNSTPDLEYKIGTDGRAYTKNGNEVKVFDPVTVGWVDVGVDAGLKEPGLQKRYSESFAQHEGKGWTASEGREYPRYTIKPLEKAIVMQMSKDAHSQQFNTVTQKWMDIGDYNPAAPV